MKPRQKNGWATLLQMMILALLVYAAINYQTLLDQYALATFTPAPNVAAITTRLELTEPARGIFYRAEPRIDTKTAFNADCQTQPHELELGCYSGFHIFVLQIDNASLIPEMDVVTAHELLHAVWARMSASE